MGNVVHWLLFFFVFGGLAILFLSRPQQTQSLMNTAVNTGLGGVADIMHTYVQGVPPA